MLRSPKNIQFNLCESDCSIISFNSENEISVDVGCRYNEVMMKGVLPICIVADTAST